MGVIYSNALLERLAAEEHQQWSTWAKTMIRDMSPENMERWLNQLATPYDQLSEEDKEKDRVWARRVLDILGYLP